MRCLMLLGVAFLVGCTSSLPVMQTGTPGEYLVVARNSAAIFSSLEEAQREAQSKTLEYCRGVGKPYVKRYVIDRPIAIGQVPESNLYFSCEKLGDISSTAVDGANASSMTFDQAKVKCIDLGFKVGTDSFGQCLLKLAK